MKARPESKKKHQVAAVPQPLRSHSSEAKWIVVKGARTHNLKNITVAMPRNAMIVFTGLSGSGKSSLAFDTIFAEGQRRYVESLSAYARQFLNTMQKPDVDEIIGLSPAISIDQKSASRNPRSTVATVTEIYDYLRVLYARLGRPHCLVCEREIQKLSPEEMLEIVSNKVHEALQSAKKKKATLIITAPVVRGRKGEYYQLLYNALNNGFSEIFLDGARKSLRERVILSKNKKHDIDLVVDELLLQEFTKFPETSEERLSEAVQRALEETDGLVQVHIGSERLVLSAKFSCPYDGFSYPEVEPRLFSFNSPYGACEACNGLGTKHFFGNDPCDVCHGSRLREEALHVLIGGKNIVALTKMMTAEAKQFFDELNLTARETEIASVVLREVGGRLQFLLNVGLSYLTLDRRANTLSGGEAQRIRLASQLGSKLVGALYVLDEPTIGLHQRDNDRLIETLKALRDLGNTILIVEHDEDTIFTSDYIVDIGPRAGVHGGEVVVSGYLEDLLSAPKNTSGSLTLAYLRGEEQIPIPATRRSKEKGMIKIRGGHLFNISNMNVDIPLGRLTVVTGVSGSGKSTFLYEILHKNLQARFDRRYKSNEVFNCISITGTEYLSRAVLIDQSPIGRTPRSNPATYTGAFNHVRDLFAASEEARVRGWKAGRFSFNRPGGRCETCEGNGFIAVEMHFLPTVYVQCDVCDGKRFTKETLEVKYKHKNIHQVLEMTVEEAFSFFADIPAIADRLKTLNEVGLGYLKLGQSATTLSGGEAQRVKISSELYRQQVERTIYLLDEPTIGLHYEDVKKLIEILERLVVKGNTVMVIEHNMDLIKSADYIIDIGPEGGAGGGKIIATGTPEQVAKTLGSHTGHYLKRALTQHHFKQK
ncbi:MAG: excinuclease ABC subunit UvrA [Candidatus Moranbacteria bacterium]|nr:excinuclease ABC subunit UvrA [Candidatus Moranbacteria bacterium]